MKTDKVTVMNKGTKASGGTKARKRPQSPEGKAIGALMRHKTKQNSSETKRIKHEKQVIRNQQQSMMQLLRERIIGEGQCLEHYLTRLVTSTIEQTTTNENL